MGIPESNLVRATGYFNTGKELSQEGKLEEAIAFYRKAIELQPDSPDIHYNLGQTLAQQSLWDEAIFCYKRAIELNPGFWKFYLSLGESLVKKSLFEEAVSSYKNAIQRKPDFPWTYYSLGNVLVEQNLLDEAIACYQKAIALHPPARCFWFYLALGNAQTKQGKLQEAVSSYQVALSLNPQEARVHSALGDVLFRQGKLEEAIGCCRRAMELNPKLFESYHTLGEALYEFGDWQEAISCYRRAIELNPNSFKSYEKLGQALEEHPEAQSSDVRACYKQLENSPDDAELYFKLAEALSKEGQLDRGVACYLKAIEIDPKFSKSYFSLRTAQILPEQWEQAIALYRSALELHPDFLPPYINLAYALSKQGKLEEAVSYYQKAIYQQTLTSHPNFVKKHWSASASRKPHFLIIGAEKAGTSSLYQYMVEHPQILPAIEKEIHFFTQEYDRGVDWYLAHFPPIPETAEFLTGEASTSYLTSDLKTIQRCFDLLPNIKLLVILRNPVDRAISHYHQVVRLGKESRTLEEVVRADLEILLGVENPLLDNTYWKKTQRGYLGRSMYVYWLEKWTSIFPKEQFLILKSEEFYSSPQVAMKLVFNFLGLPDYQMIEYPNYNSGSYDPLVDSIRSKLSRFFQPHNQKLEKYLGREFYWE